MTVDHGAHVWDYGLPLPTVGEGDGLLFGLYGDG